MKRLVNFLYQRSAFVIFVFLEFASVGLFLHRAQHHISILHAVAGINKFISEIKRYPLLKEENTALLRDMAILQERCTVCREQKTSLPIIAPQQGKFIPTRIVNNSIIGTKNYMTLDKGSLHGIAPGMGVMSSHGIVGKVKDVSEHFATVISVLHTSMQVSAKISPSGVLGTVQWTGQDPFRARMLYVPRHVPIKPGQPIVTSGYNSTFLADTLIGHISRVQLRKEAPFYDIELQLSTDLSVLQYAFVVKKAFEQEKRNIEQQTYNFYE